MEVARPGLGKRMLAYVTGSIDEELLARNEYLAAENHILKAQLLTASTVVFDHSGRAFFQIDGAMNVQAFPPAGLLKSNLCVFVPNNPRAALRA